MIFLENPITELEKKLLQLNPSEFTLISIVIGYILSNGLNSLEIQSMGNFIFSIGQTMSTIGTQKQSLESKYQLSDNELKKMFSLLNEKIGNLEKIITDLKKLY